MWLMPAASFRTVAALVCGLFGSLATAEAARGQAPKPLPRVLLIGDSISIGYTAPVRKRLAGTAEVVRPNENCQHTAHGLKRLDAWLGDGKWDAIHFNWGIWDTHMLDAAGGLIRNEAGFTGAMHLRHTPDQYRGNLTELADRLGKTKAKLVWASTTPVMSRTGKRFDDVAALNAVAADVMKERKIPVNDLYEAVLPNAKEWQSGDRVHFTEAGNEALAERVAASVRAALGVK